MKKMMLIVALVVSLFAVTIPAQADSCWDIEAKHAEIVLDGVLYVLDFGLSFVGPCPAGRVNFTWCDPFFGTVGPCPHMFVFYVTQMDGSVDVHFTETIGSGTHPVMTFVIDGDFLVWIDDPNIKMDLGPGLWPVEVE